MAALGSAQVPAVSPPTTDTDAPGASSTGPNGSVLAGSADGDDGSPGRPIAVTRETIPSVGLGV